MYFNVLFVLNDLTPGGNVGTSQRGVCARDGFIGAILFVCFETLTNNIESTALSRAWHGSVRTYLKMGVWRLHMTNEDSELAEVCSNR